METDRPTFLIKKTTNGNYRAINEATEKVEPLIAGEPDALSAMNKVQQMYPRANVKIVGETIRG